jgi:hypothetical protein
VQFQQFSASFLFFFIRSLGGPAASSEVIDAIGSNEPGADSGSLSQSNISIIRNSNGLATLKEVIDVIKVEEEGVDPANPMSP